MKTVETAIAEQRQQMRVLLDAKQAADALATSPRRVTELRRAGLIRAVLDGRQYKYRPEDLATYAAALPATG